MTAATPTPAPCIAAATPPVEQPLHVCISFDIRSQQLMRQEEDAAVIQACDAAGSPMVKARS